MSSPDASTDSSQTTPRLQRSPNAFFNSNQHGSSTPWPFPNPFAGNNQYSDWVVPIPLSPRSQNRSRENLQVVTSSSGPRLTLVTDVDSESNFRYMSETCKNAKLVALGLIAGKGSGKKKATRAFPTLKLQNCHEAAAETVIIRCTLHTADDYGGIRRPHVHELIDKTNRKPDPIDIRVTAPRYEAVFKNLVIIFTGIKKQKAKLLEKKIRHESSSLIDPSRHNLSPDRLEELRNESESEVVKIFQDKKLKQIVLNTACLRFETLIKTNGRYKPISGCQPVYSSTIKNQHSVDFCNLEICEASHSIGSCQGNDRVFLLVDKVRKGNIKVKFFQLPNWTILVEPENVQGQRGIIFKTPAYSLTDISSNVQVYFQLYRESDGSFSEPWTWTYTPHYIFQQAQSLLCHHTLGDSSRPSHEQGPPPSGLHRQTLSPLSYQPLPGPSTSFDAQVPSSMGFHSQPSPSYQPLESFGYQHQPSLGPLSSSQAQERELSETQFHPGFEEIPLQQLERVLGPSYSKEQTYDPMETEQIINMRYGSDAFVDLDGEMTAQNQSEGANPPTAPMEINQPSTQTHVRKMVKRSGQFRGASVSVLMKLSSKKLQPLREIKKPQFAKLAFGVSDENNDLEEILSLNQEISSVQNSKSIKSPPGIIHKFWFRTKNLLTKGACFWRSTDTMQTTTLSTTECARDHEILSTTTTSRRMELTKTTEVEQAVQKMFFNAIGEGKNSLFNILLDEDSEKAQIVAYHLKNYNLSTVVNQKNFNGETTLHIAVKAGKTRMVNVLLDAGADVDVKNNEQLTALQLAVASKHASAVEITQALMAKQPDITVVNRDGLSVLHSLIVEQRMDLILALLVRPAAVNTTRQLIRLKDKAGNTALHIAVSRGLIDIVELLLHFVEESDFNERNLKGQSPLDLANASSDTEGQKMKAYLSFYKDNLGATEKKVDNSMEEEDSDSSSCCSEDISSSEVSSTDEEI